jgi:RHS repeat-associated protein
MKLAAYTYLADGKVGQVDYGNGARSAIGYDERGFINAIDHYNVPLNHDCSSRQYWRDERDRITAFQKSYNPGANPMEDGRGDRFRYDEEGQLVEGWYGATNPSVSGGGNSRYDGFGYDALGNRMYQPELGRFLQPDPKQFGAGDYNLYRYCHNDPVNKSDPTGLTSEIAADIYKQKLMPVLGSNIRQWVTTLAIHFTLSGNFSDRNPLNHVVSSLRANGADAKGRTDSDIKVRDVGAKGLNANLNINYWIVNSRYDSLERQHTWGAEGSRTKGLLEPGGYLSRMQERWKEGIGAPFGRDIASWWLEGDLRAQLQMARSEQRDTWDINGDHNR